MDASRGQEKWEPVFRPDRATKKIRGQEKWEPVFADADLRFRPDRAKGKASCASMRKRLRDRHLLGRVDVEERVDRPARTFR